METIKQLEKEIEDYRNVLRKENVEKQINNLVALLYDKLGDEDVRILEISHLKETLKQTNEIIKMIEEELWECQKMLKDNPLNDYWLGREIVLEKIITKLRGSK